VSKLMGEMGVFEFIRLNYGLLVLLECILQCRMIRRK
jgi:hypothetical protein